MREKRQTGAKTAAAPEGYYQASYSAMARNSSEKLDVTEKLQLITGQWDSIREEPQDFELEHTDYEVAELAQKGIDMLYRSGLYPENITGYENWYSWQATPHKADCDRTDGMDGYMEGRTAIYGRSRYGLSDRVSAEGGK